MNRDTISPSQLTILVTAYTFGSSLVLGSTNIAVRSGWIAMALGTVEGLLIALLFTTLSKRFQHQNLVQASQQVFGRILGAIPSLLFIWFMLQLGGLVLGNFEDYFEITMLQATPAIWFGIPLGLVAAYAVSKGVDTLARSTTILLPLIILLELSTFVALLGEMIPENFLPLIDVGGKQLLAVAHSAGMFPFAESVVFLMMLPHLPAKCDTRKPVLGGLLLAGLVLTMSTFRNIAVLGAAIENVVFPSFTATRLISVGEVFTRLEIISAVSFLTMGFVKVSVLLYGAAAAIAELCGLRSHQPLILPVGVLMVILSITDFQHGFAESHVFITETWPYYAPLFAVGLPLVILLGAMVFGKPRRDEQ
ncbi:MAG: GerAB/ArcD/ProY family transporter [Bacillota bacterium]|jgi:spore germination protein KB